MPEDGFWRNFISADNQKVNSPTVIGAVLTIILTALAIPVTILGMAAVHHHVWVLKKGLDSSVTSLLLGLAGGGGIGCGVGYGVSRFGRTSGLPPDWKPPPAQPSKGD